MGLLAVCVCSLSAAAVAAAAYDITPANFPLGEPSYSTFPPAYKPWVQGVPSSQRIGSSSGAYAAQAWMDSTVFETGASWATVVEPASGQMLLAVTMKTAFQSFAAEASYLIFMPNVSTVGVAAADMPLLQTWGALQGALPAVWNSWASFALAFDKAGILYVGTNTGAVFRASRTDTSLTRLIRDNPDTSGRNHINTIAVDTDGTIYYTSDADYGTTSVWSIPAQQAASDTAVPVGYPSSMIPDVVSGVGIRGGYIFLLSLGASVYRFPGGQGSLNVSAGVQVGGTICDDYMGPRDTRMDPLSGSILAIGRVHVSYAPEDEVYVESIFHVPYDSVANMPQNLTAAQLPVEGMDWRTVSRKKET